MAEVSYLWNLLDAGYATQNDVALFGPAKGWNDGGQIIVDEAAAEYALRLTRDDAYLTIGGDYSSASSCNLSVKSSNDPESGDFPAAVAAVDFQSSGHVHFAAQSGAGTAGSVDGGTPANLDENIWIEAQYTANTANVPKISPVVPSALAVYGISANGKLDVIGSVSGTVKAALKSTRDRYEVDTMTSDSYVQSYYDSAVNCTDQAAAIRSTDALTVGTNFQATLDADNATTVTARQEYTHTIPFDTTKEATTEYATSVTISGNTVAAYGITAGSLTGDTCVWQGSVKSRNRSKMLASADNYQKKDVVESVTVSGNQAAAYGVQTTGDVVIDRFDGSSWDVQADALEIKGEVADLASEKEDEIKLSTLAVQNNAIRAVGIAAANLAAANGASNLQMEVSASNNAISGKDTGSNDNTVYVSGNTVNAAGIKASGSVALGDLTGSELTVSADGNTASAVGAAGIQAQTVTLGNVDGDTEIKVSVSGNKLTVNYEDATYSERIVTGRGIQADALTLGDYEGSIDLKAANNGNTYKLDAVAVSVAGAFKARSLKGSVSVSESGNGIFNVMLAYSDDRPRCTVAAIKAGSLTVDGVFSTAVTDKVEVEDYSAYGYGIINPIAYNAAVDVSGALTANGFSGTVNEGVSEVQCGVGLQAIGGFYSTVTGDLFDVNGGIYGVTDGIASAAALKLRVSGEIEASDYAIHAESYYTQSLDSFTDDFVEIASTAKLTGAIELGGGDNKLLIDSGATIDGNLLATKGRLSLYFDLDEVNGSAVISTDANDVTLYSTMYVSINLNNAENNQTYTLFQFDGDVKKNWANRTIAFVYNNDVYTGETDENGHLVCYCYNEAGTVKAEFNYTAGNAVTVSVSGVVNPTALDTTKATTEYDAETAAFTIDWSKCISADTVQSMPVAELEYQLKDAAGNAYGETITVSLTNGATSYAVQGVLEGEELSWRLRYSNDEYHSQITGWSDLTTKTAEVEPEPEPVVPSTPDVSNCNLQVGDPDDRTKAAGGAIRTAVARLYWDGAESETPIENYTVEYVEIRNRVTDAEAIKNLFNTQTVYSKEVTGTEVLVSGLTNGSYVYWRLKAEDIDNAESEYAYGQFFQVGRQDTIPPVMGESYSQIWYSYGEEFGINADILWEPAYDAQSGVKSYTVEYAVSGTEDWTLACTQLHDDAKTDCYSVTVNGLKNENYTYRITAYDYCNNASVQVVTDGLPKDAAAPQQGNTYSRIWYSYGEELGIHADIAWDAASDQQSGVKSYTVEYAVKDTEDWVTAATVDHVVGQASYAITINGLENKDYAYRITAYDYCGNASVTTKTDELQADVTAPTQGNAYSQLRYSYVGGFDIQADIAWDAASDQQSGVAGYVVEYAVEGTEDWKTAATVAHVAGKASYAITINGLENKDYAYRITAYDYCGNAAVTTRTGELKADVTAPVLKEDSLATSVNYYSLGGAEYYVSTDFAWLPGTDVGSGIEKYELTYWDVNKTAETTTVTVKASDITSEGYYLANVTLPYNGETYSYQLSATDYCGNVSNVLSGGFGGEDVMAPTGSFLSFNDPEISVVYEEVDDTSTVKTLDEAEVTFSWSDTYTDTMSPVCYKIQFSYSAEFNDDYTYTFYNTPADGKTFTLNNERPTMSVGVLSALANLSGEKKVYWRVMAMDNPGNDAQYSLVTEGNETGIWSATQSFYYLDSDGDRITTKQDPAEATDVTVSHEYSEQHYLTGTNLSFTIEHTLIGVQEIVIAVQNCATGAITSRTVSYGMVQNTSTSSGDYSKLSGLFADLEDGNYEICIRTDDALGHYNRTKRIGFMVDTTRPTTVTGVQAHGSGSDVTISWNPSYDANGIAGYTVAYRYKTSGGNAEWNYTAMTQNTYTTLFDVADGEYEIAVFAADNANSDLFKPQSNYSLSSEIIVYSTETPAHSAVTQSDYNGSGKSDMIQFVNGLVYVTYDTDSGYVQTPAINDVTGWNVVEIRRDLTGDGLADLQITSDDGAGSTWVATLRNDYLATGCITLNYQFIGAYDNKLWSYLGSADVNNDGKSEVLMIQTEAGADSYGHRNVAAWVTDETGTWVGNTWVGSLTDEWNVAGTADLTGDGEDNVILRKADGTIGYWSSAGTNDVVELKSAGARVLLTTGDFDGDGADDFLWQSANGKEFSTWTDVDGSLSDAAIGQVSDLGGNWTFAGVGDYNGDGKDEILWCDTVHYHTAYGEANQENFANLVVLS